MRAPFFNSLWSLSQPVNKTQFWLLASLYFEQILLELSGDCPGKIFCTNVFYRRRPSRKAQSKDKESRWLILLTLTTCLIAADCCDQVFCDFQWFLVFLVIFACFFCVLFAVTLTTCLIAADCSHQFLSHHKWFLLSLAWKTTKENTHTLGNQPKKHTHFEKNTHTH